MSGSREGSKLPASSAAPVNPNPPSSCLPITPITVVLVPKAAADLQVTHERTHLSKTDIDNRAVSLYEFVDAELQAGGELIVRRDGQEYLVNLM